jgi:hypothetical protein
VFKLLRTHGNSEKVNISTPAGFRKRILLHKTSTGCCRPTKQIDQCQALVRQLARRLVLCIPEVVNPLLDSKFYYHEYDFSWLSSAPADKHRNSITASEYGTSTFKCTQFIGNCHTTSGFCVL